jgi:uncharacterized SAM-binding protein YcdF (DUF218 family)
LKDALNNIIYFPLPIFWLIIFISVFAKKKNISFYIKILGILFYVTLTPIFASLIDYPLRKNSHTYTGENILAVLVPTAGIYKDIQSKWYPSSNTVQRVAQGELLAKELKKPLIISGGILNIEGVSETSITRKLVTYQNTKYEDKSKNSYETVINLKTFYNPVLYKKEKILLVTSPKHILRMSLLLSTHGFSVVSYNKHFNKDINIYSFLPDIRTVSSNNASLYEYFAIINYIYKKYIVLL